MYGLIAHPHEPLFLVLPTSAGTPATSGATGDALPTVHAAERIGPMSTHRITQLLQEQCGLAGAEGGAAVVAHSVETGAGNAQ